MCGGGGGELLGISTHVMIKELKFGMDSILMMIYMINSYKI